MMLRCFTWFDFSCTGLCPDQEPLSTIADTINHHSFGQFTILHHQKPWSTTITYQQPSLIAYHPSLITHQFSIINQSFWNKNIYCQSPQPPTGDCSAPHCWPTTSQSAAELHRSRPRRSLCLCCSLAADAQQGRHLPSVPAFRACDGDALEIAGVQHIDWIDGGDTCHIDPEAQTAGKRESAEDFQTWNCSKLAKVSCNHMHYTGQLKFVNKQMTIPTQIGVVVGGPHLGIQGAGSSRHFQDEDHHSENRPGPNTSCSCCLRALQPALPISSHQ